MAPERDLPPSKRRWEHRFFGASYLVSFDHRRPLSVWSFRASRDITSYPQQLANLSAGGDVNGLLNTLFASRVPDPAARQTFVDQFIRQRGLPPTLAGPISLFSQQVTLEESARGVARVARRAKQRGFESLQAPQRAYRWRGRYCVRRRSFDSNRQYANGCQRRLDSPADASVHPWRPPPTGRARLRTISAANDRAQGTLQLVISARLSLLTSVYAGARYQRITSNLAGSRAGVRRVRRHQPHVSTDAISCTNPSTG